jgi:hypothetical protein
MDTCLLSHSPVARQTWIARAEVERARDDYGWWWSGHLSLWIDALVLLEEAAP